MNRTRVVLTTCVAGMLTVGLVSGCGRGADAGRSGVAGETVTLGIVTPMNGPTASSFGQATVDAAQARIDLANATNELPGGIELKLVSADEGNSPQTSLTATQHLVENEKVFAVLAAGAFFYGAYRYAAQKNIPVIGNGIDGTEWGSSQYRNMFAAFGSTDLRYPSYKGLPEYFRSRGGSVYCGVAYKAPSTITNGSAMVGSVEAAGMSVPYTNFGVTPGEANFDSIALSIKNADCDIVGTQMTLGDSLALITAVKNADVRLKATFVQGGYGQELLDDPAALKAAQGLNIAAGYMPASLKAPGIRRMMGALRTYAGWTKPYPPSGAQWGWFTANTAIKGLKVAGANPTQQGFIDNLRKVTNFDHDGLTCPVDYSKFGDTNQQFPGNCTWMVTVKGREFVSDTGKEPIRIVTVPGTSNVR